MGLYYGTLLCRMMNELCRREAWETFLVNSSNLLKIKKRKLSLLVS